ncbi:hypothetical protein HHK36_014532 [Tetracentron sinense]|uniref:Ribulose bisphosphate carboxylase large subunit C-terminal domain-containing protein n=1 Tax=Tetracentron sinense TaxID=13715 RepID=A0A834Z8L2_TETSI|nr:hypothetical protein HHK36_014532 [Tetracentron sinense]
MKGTKQEQEGSTEEDPSPSLCSEEKEDPDKIDETGGFTANTSLSYYCRDNGLLLHIHRAMHAVIDRQKNHGIHFRVLAKALRMSGGDHIHSGSVVDGSDDTSSDYCIRKTVAYRKERIQKNDKEMQWNS